MKNKWYRKLMVLAFTAILLTATLTACDLTNVQTSGSVDNQELTPTITPTGLLENHDEIARFSIVNHDILELLSAAPPIIANAGTRFVYSPNAPEFFTGSDVEQHDNPIDLDADAHVNMRSLIRRDLDDEFVRFSFNTDFPALV